MFVTRIVTVLYIIVAGVLSLLASAVVAESDLAIEGYSPVSYFTEGAAQRGSPEFAARHEGKLYYMTSPKQLHMFRENPEKFVPALGAHCPYSLSLGRSVAIDPERFKIIDGRLYLFHRSEELDALKAWNEADDTERRSRLESAKSRFILMRF